MRKMTKWSSLMALALMIPMLALAGGKGAWLSNAYLQTFFRTTATTAPTTLYAGLLGTCPTAGNNGTELTGNGYQRGDYNGTSVVGIAKADASWNYTAATFIGPATISNVSAIRFPTVTTANWTANCFALYDAPTGGNMVMWGDLTVKPTTITVGATASFAGGTPGAMVITEN